MLSIRVDGVSEILRTTFQGQPLFFCLSEGAPKSSESILGTPGRPGFQLRQLLECSDLFTEMLRRRQPFNERDAREVHGEVTVKSR